MNRQVGPLAASFLGLVCALAAIPASALPLGGTPNDTYTYNYVITLPTVTISSGAEAPSSPAVQVDFSWLGPLRIDSPPNSDLGAEFVGVPVAGWHVDELSFTADGTEPEVIVEYENPNDTRSLTFTFVEPNSFWATTGEQNFTANGLSQVAANYTISTIGGEELDPPCSDCSIGTNAEPPISTTPEPSSLLLLGSGLVGLAGLIRRKIGLRA